MKATDKMILGGAFLTGVVGVLAYKGKLRWPGSSPRPTPARAGGGGSAPVHPSQTGAGTPAYQAQAAAPTAPSAPASPAVDPSQVYAVGEGEGSSGAAGGDQFVSDVGD